MFREVEVEFKVKVKVKVEVKVDGGSCIFAGGGFGGLACTLVEPIKMATV
jgi:hypothetical protein